MAQELDPIPTGASTAGLTGNLDGTEQAVLKFGGTQLTIGKDSLVIAAPAYRQCSTKKEESNVWFWFKYVLESLSLSPVSPPARSINADAPLSAASDSESRSIPLYNVLWASLSDENRTLTIDFAEPASKTRLRPATLTYTLPEAPEPEPEQQLSAAETRAAWVETLLDRSYGPAARRKRAYVLVNPHAGPGGADKKYEQQARPIFEAARMHLDTVTTTYSGAAVELCHDMDVDAYDIVVACSGDGLPHECFNGLGQRPDARRALSKIAVCHIPCGSGNAMACNLYGTHKPSLAALAIVKGAPTPMDLVSITQAGRPRLLSFLSQALGIVAEADLATEHLRWMGGARFTWGFLERFLAKKVYPCDLAVKVEIEHKEGVRQHYSARQRGDSSTSALGAAGKSSSVLAGDTTSEDATSSAAPGASEEGLPPLRYGTIEDKLPDGWEMIPHDKMGNFYCGNMAYMAPDANFFSAACINDGLMDLVTIDGDLPPLKSLRLLLSVEDGRFFDNPLVQYRKITGFRIVPRDQADGYISIDGERVPFAPFQAEVHQGLGTVLSKRGEYEAPGPRDWDKVSATDRFMA